MTQKTNQFNLTTKRYAEKDIENMIEKELYKTYAFSVEDKFGDSGITGLCILKFDYNLKSVEIDSLLMSCRIIGRNIEYAIIDFIINLMKERGINTINSKFIKTKKNEQVKDFYNKCSFNVTQTNESVINYELEISNYNKRKPNYIDIVYE